MAQELRSRDPVSDSDDEVESGEEKDEAVMDMEEDTAAKPSSGKDVASRRKRGNLWSRVAMEGELVSSLANVHTTESSTPKACGFVDLDNPSTSAGGLKEVVGKPGQKRKNTLKPKPKRRADKERTHYFTRFPDLSSEIEDTDSVDVAARKAAFQLQEKWNPWTITQIVNHLGNAEARKLLQLTKTIQSNGGMLTKDGGTKRTPGGVFITLFRSDAEAKLGKDFVKRLFAFPDGTPAKPKDLKKKQKAVRKRAERRAAAAAATARTTAPQIPQEMEVAVPGPGGDGVMVPVVAKESDAPAEAVMDVAVDPEESISKPVLEDGH